MSTVKVNCEWLERVEAWTTEFIQSKYGDIKTAPVWVGDVKENPESANIHHPALKEEDGDELRAFIQKKLSGADRLTELFRMQEELNDATFKKQGIMASANLDIAEKATLYALKTADIAAQAKVGGVCHGPNALPNIWLRNYLRALQEEGKELEAELLWKWWSKSGLDMQNIRVEIIDILHFWMSLALAAGMTADDVWRIYLQKNAVNHKRQENGYSTETKTEDDNKAIK